MLRCSSFKWLTVILKPADIEKMLTSDWLVEYDDGSLFLDALKYMSNCFASNMLRHVIPKVIMLNVHRYK